MQHPIPILMYHSIDTQCTDAYGRWALPPATFDRHMELLAENDYRPITVSALTSLLRTQQTVPPRTVAITFDDGLRDFLTGAMPVLRRYNFPATLYVVSGCVGSTSNWLVALGEGSRPMLSWEELRSLSTEGIEIGAHTVSHPQLDLLSPATAFEEISSSKTVLEEYLGSRVRSFAYPYGYASPKTRQLVHEAGFSSACRVRHALSSTTEDCFALSRIIMTRDIGDEKLLIFLRGSSLPIAPPHDRLLSSGWRLVRRIGHRTGVPR
jgi:O-antigen biosynthesis protein